jgi:hypothetical protein
MLRIVCPACNGDGGEMSGYYEPEFSECQCCNERGDNEEEVTRVWRWRWWWFRFNQWRADRALDRWIEQEIRRENLS